MADYVINCPPNSLLEYVGPIPNRGIGRELVTADAFQDLFSPFFTVDFEVGEISQLIEDKGKESKAAGICIISGMVRINPNVLIQQEMVYAFRVEWDDSAENLVRSEDLQLDKIAELKIPMIPPGEADILNTLLAGKITWQQQETEEYKLSKTLIPPVFTFFDVFTLRRLLLDEGCTHLRFRKTLVKSKAKQNDTTTPKIYNFLNLTLETVPTFRDKSISNIVNQLTDQDVLAHDYGYPCPPEWREGAGSFLKQFRVINRSQLIVIGNGKAITMGALVDAVVKNDKAKSLLKNWTLYPEAKKLNIFSDGKRVILE